jgi:hypothetical protein
MRPPLGVLLLASLLVTSGCLGALGASRPPSDQRALDALDRTRAALAPVTSYRARVDGAAELTAGEERETVALDGEVLVDVSARETNGTGRLSDVFLPGTAVRRTYVTGYTAYTECRLTGWGRQNLSESRRWFAYTPLGEQLAVLNRTPVYWNGTRRLDGTETAVVVAHPTEAELEAAPGEWSLSPSESEDAILRDATLTLWLSTRTWLPLQARRETTWRDAGADATLTATWQFDAYDEPVAVTRPSFDESELRARGC